MGGPERPDSEEIREHSGEVLQDEHRQHAIGVLDVGLVTAGRSLVFGLLDGLLIATDKSELIKRSHYWQVVRIPILGSWLVRES